MLPYYRDSTNMPGPLTENEVERIKAQFREALGRELTGEELRCLGLSCSVLPQEEGQQPKVKAAKSKR